MSKYKETFGVDISKGIFDVHGSTNGHNQFKNDEKGFTCFLKTLPLYLCAFSACKHNKACRDLYERITNKGKSKKLALIAVSNKLLKQCFAIAKSGNPYDPTHVSVLKIK